MTFDKQSNGHQIEVESNGSQMTVEKIIVVTTA